MQCDQLLDERQADAKAALRSLLRRLNLGEHVVDTGQHLGRNADTVVLYGHDHFVAFALHGRQSDVTSRVGVLAGVVQQVAEYLGEPPLIAVYVNRVGWQRHDDFVLQAFRQWTAGLDGVLQHGGELRMLLAQFQLVTGDATDVEQIVHEPDHLCQLSLHGLLGLPENVAAAVRAFHDLQHIVKRRERTSQFVGQDRQELILAAVGLLELDKHAVRLLFGTLAVGDISHDTGEIALLAQCELTHRQFHRKCAAVLAATLHFPAYPDDLRLSGAQVLGKVALVLAVIGFRHQRVDVPAENFLGLISEQSFSGRIERLHPAFFVDGDDAVDDVVNDRTDAFFGFAESLDLEVDLLREQRMLFLGFPARGDIAKDQHRAEQLSSGVLDRCAAVVDRYFTPVSCDQHGMVRQPDDHAFPHRPQRRVLDRLARLLVDDVEDLRDRLPHRFLLIPAGQRLGDVVEKAHRAVTVGRDHRVADARQRDAQPFVRLPLSGFALLGFSPRPVQALGQQADERAGEQEDDQLWRGGRIGKPERVGRRNEEVPGNQSAQCRRQQTRPQAPKPRAKNNGWVEQNEVHALAKDRPEDEAQERGERDRHDGKAIRNRPVAGKHCRPPRDESITIRQQTSRIRTALAQAL